MNKLALFSLLVICGAVFATDCTTFNTSATCTDSSCAFTPSGTTTCTNNCAALSQTDCISATNKDNCTPIAASCTVAFDCSTYITNQNTCTGATADGKTCAFTPAKDASCSVNGDNLTNTCQPLNTSEANCQANNMCIFKDVSLKSCGYNAGKCAALSNADCTAAANYCTWNAAATPNPICEDNAATGQDNCVKLTTTTDCNLVPQCIATTNPATCVANDTFCTNAKAQKDCNTDNCTFAPAVIVSCKNTNDTTCKGLTADAACTGNTSCKLVNASCTNVDAKKCLSTDNEANCTAAAKFCTFTTNGTCATKTTNAAILAVAGAFLAFIAML